MAKAKHPGRKPGREGNPDSARAETSEPGSLSAQPGGFVGTVTGWARMRGTGSRASIVVLAVAMVGWFAVDRLLGQIDGDNPELSVLFIRDNPRAYVFSGLLLWVMSIALLIAVLTVSDLLTARLADSLAVRAVTVVGFFSSGFFLLLGAIRVSTPGTLIYIADLDSEWGEAAYLAVQMIGLQGLSTRGDPRLEPVGGGSEPPQPGGERRLAGGVAGGGPAGVAGDDGDHWSAQRGARRVVSRVRSVVSGHDCLVRDVGGFTRSAKSADGAPFGLISLLRRTLRR